MLGVSFGEDPLLFLEISYTTYASIMKVWYMSMFCVFSAFFHDLIFRYLLAKLVFTVIFFNVTLVNFPYRTSSYISFFFFFVFAKMYIISTGTHMLAKTLFEVKVFEEIFPDFWFVPHFCAIGHQTGHSKLQCFAKYCATSVSRRTAVFVSICSMFWHLLAEHLL